MVFGLVSRLGIGFFICDYEVANGPPPPDPHLTPLCFCLCLGVLDPVSLTPQEQTTRSREFNASLSADEKISRIREAGATEQELVAAFTRTGSLEYQRVARKYGLSWPGMSRRNFARMRVVFWSKNGNNGEHQWVSEHLAGLIADATAKTTTKKKKKKGGVKIRREKADNTGGRRRRPGLAGLRSDFPPACGLMEDIRMGDAPRVPEVEDIDDSDDDDEDSSSVKSGASWGY